MVMSIIPIPEEYCKRLTHTPRLGESQPTRVTKRPTKPDSLTVNIYESPYITIVKVLDLDKASSEYLHLTPEEGTIQLGEIIKLSNTNSWKYLTEFILDVIRAPWEGM